MNIIKQYLTLCQVQGITEKKSIFCTIINKCATAKLSIMYAVFIRKVYLARKIESNILVHEKRVETSVMKGYVDHNHNNILSRGRLSPSDVLTIRETHLVKYISLRMVQM